MKLRELRLRHWLPPTIELLIRGVGTSTPTEPYIASFQTPTVQLNKTASIGYQINLTIAESTIAGISILLCQTSDKTSVDAKNSWQVLSLLSGSCLTSSSLPDETCKNKPYKGRENLQFTLLQDAAFNSTGTDSLNNYFLCISHTDTTVSTTCDYSSSIFDILPAVGEANPSAADPLITAAPSLYSAPTHLSLTITSTRSNVLQTLFPVSSSSLVSSATTPVRATAKPKPKPKKGLSTAGTIGLAFGILSLLALIGLIALVLLRRSGSRKRAQAARTLNIDPSQYSNYKAEKANGGSPTSLSAGWVMRNSQLPKIGKEDKDIPGLSALSKGPTMPQVSSNQNACVGESSVHLRDMSYRKSNKRSSGGSVTISPIPSLRSDSPYDPYPNVENTPNEIRHGSGPGMGSAAPFLREEGMSAEEMAKLEDEERRIDAAIAAADAERLKHR